MEQLDKVQLDLVYGVLCPIQVQKEEREGKEEKNEKSQSKEAIGHQKEEEEAI